MSSTVTGFEKKKSGAEQIRPMALRMDKTTQNGAVVHAAHCFKMGFRAASLNATVMLRQLLLQAWHTVPIGSRSVRTAACMLSMSAYPNHMALSCEPGKS